MTSISILGRQIAVKRATAKHLERIAKDKACWGIYDGETIYLSRALSKEQAKRVLVHEITHAVLQITGITNLLEDKHEEAICDASEALVDVFKDPKMAKFLSE